MTSPSPPVLLTSILSLHYLLFSPHPSTTHQYTEYHDAHSAHPLPSAQYSHSFPLISAFDVDFDVEFYIRGRLVGKQIDVPQAEIRKCYEYQYNNNNYDNNIKNEKDTSSTLTIALSCPINFPITLLNTPYIIRIFSVTFPYHHPHPSSPSPLLLISPHTLFTPLPHDFLCSHLCPPLLSPSHLQSHLLTFSSLFSPFFSSFLPLLLSSSPLIFSSFIILSSSSSQQGKSYQLSIIHSILSNTHLYGELSASLPFPSPSSLSSTSSSSSQSSYSSPFRLLKFANDDFLPQQYPFSSFFLSKFKEEYEKCNEKYEDNNNKNNKNKNFVILIDDIDLHLRQYVNNNSNKNSFQEENAMSNHLSMDPLAHPNGIDEEILMNEKNDTWEGRTLIGDLIMWWMEISKMGRGNQRMVYGCPLVVIGTSSSLSSSSTSTASFSRFSSSSSPSSSPSSSSFPLSYLSLQFPSFSSVSIPFPLQFDNYQKLFIIKNILSSLGVEVFHRDTEGNGDGKRRRDDDDLVLNHWIQMRYRHKNIGEMKRDLERMVIQYIDYGGEMVGNVGEDGEWRVSVRNVIEWEGRMGRKKEKERKKMNNNGDEDDEEGDEDRSDDEKKEKEGDEGIGIGSVGVSSPSLSSPSPLTLSSFPNFQGYSHIKSRLLLILNEWLLPSSSLSSSPFSLLGLTTPHSLLLSGPSGVGKSLLLHDILTLLSFPTIHFTLDRITSKYLGEEEENIRKIFHTARRMRECIIVIEDIDIWGAKREGGEEGEMEGRVVSTLLNELDGIESLRSTYNTHRDNSKNDTSSSSSSPKNSIYIIATTSSPHLIDSAILRPGRIDEIITLGTITGEGEMREMVMFHMGKWRRGNERWWREGGRIKRKKEQEGKDEKTLDELRKQFTSFPSLSLLQSSLLSTLDTFITLICQSSHRIVGSDIMTWSHEIGYSAWVRHERIWKSMGITEERGILVEPQDVKRISEWRFQVKI